MIFPYLPSAPPEMQVNFPAGNHQASGSLPDPWAVLPLRGSHRAVRRRKSHYAAADPGRMPETLRRLQTGVRSDRRPSSRLPLMLLPATGLYLMNVYKVVKVHFLNIRNDRWSLRFHFKKKMDVCRGPRRAAR